MRTKFLSPVALPRTTKYNSGYKWELRHLAHFFRYLELATFSFSVRRKIKGKAGCFCLIRVISLRKNLRVKNLIVIILLISIVCVWCFGGRILKAFECPLLNSKSHWVQRVYCWVAAYRIAASGRKLLRGPSSCDLPLPFLIVLCGGKRLNGHFVFLLNSPLKFFYRRSLDYNIILWNIKKKSSTGFWILPFKCQCVHLFFSIYLKQEERSWKMLKTPPKWVGITPNCW